MQNCKLKKYINRFTSINMQIKEKANKNGEIVIYRGQKDKSYELNPAVFRGNIKKYEKNLINEMLLSAPNDFSDANTYFEKLVKMQHYGLPTRLLDFTLNPLIALYFACEDAENSDSNNDGEIFVRIEKYYYSTEMIVNILGAMAFLPKREAIGYGSGGWAYDMSEAVEILEAMQQCIAVLPPLNNERIKRQQSVFLLFTEPAQMDFNLKEKMKTNLEYGFEQIIKIRAKDKKEILEELSVLGINKSFIFPEMDKKAEYLRDKYK